MASVGEITCLLERLKEGDRSSVRHLWERYFSQLVRIARGRLQGLPDHLADHENIALSAFKSFCLAADRNRFPKLDDSDDLWQVLLMLVRDKAADLWQRHTRQGRDFRRETSLASLTPDASEVGSLLDLIHNPEPDPQLAAEVAEECEQLLSLLPDEQMRCIAVLKMEGWTNPEIAEQLDCAPVTVARKLSRIRRLWQKQF